MSPHRVIQVVAIAAAAAAIVLALALGLMAWLSRWGDRGRAEEEAAERTTGE